MPVEYPEVVKENEGTRMEFLMKMALELERMAGFFFGNIITTTLLGNLVDPFIRFAPDLKTLSSVFLGRISKRLQLRAPPQEQIDYNNLLSLAIENIDSDQWEPYFPKPRITFETLGHAICIKIAELLIDVWPPVAFIRFSQTQKFLHTLFYSDTQREMTISFKTAIYRCSVAVPVPLERVKDSRINI